MKSNSSSWRHVDDTLLKVAATIMHNSSYTGATTPGTNMVIQAAYDCLLTTFSLYAIDESRERENDDSKLLYSFLPARL